MIFGPVQNKTRPVNFARAGCVLYLVVFVLVKKGIRIRTWSSLCEEPNCVALRQQVPWGKRPCQGEEGNVAYPIHDARLSKPRRSDPVAFGFWAQNPRNTGQCHPLYKQRSGTRIGQRKTAKAKRGFATCPRLSYSFHIGAVPANGVATSRLRCLHVM